MPPTLVPGATRVEAAGTPPKLIDEYVGRVNTGTTRLSVAHMRSPAGWSEPAQTPEFDEYTVGARRCDASSATPTVSSKCARARP